MSKKKSNNSKASSIQNSSKVQSEPRPVIIAQEDNSICYDYELINENVLDEKLRNKKIKTILVRNLVSEVCKSLTRTMSNSIIISGDSGSGKTTLLDFVAKEIFYTNDHGVQKGIYSRIIQIASENMPSEPNEIIEYLVGILKEVEKTKPTNLGKLKVTVLLDDIWLFPSSFVTDFSCIYQEIINRTDLASLKFVSTVHSKILEQVGNSWDIISNSFLVNIVPEKNPEIICTMLYNDVKAIYIKNNRTISKEKIIEMSDYEEETIKAFIDKAWVAFAAVASSDSEERMYNYNAFLHFVDGIIGNLSERWALMNEGEEKEAILTFNKTDYIHYIDKKRESVIKHEAGHCVLALVNPELFWVDGVCCIPDLEHGISGVTLIRQKCGDYTEESLIKVIGFYLAGRIAQGKPYNATAGNDLAYANQFAKDFVMKSGVFRSIGYNVYFESNTTISEKRLENLEKEVAKLLKKAEKYAKSILKKYNPLFQKICKKLEDYPILTSKDLEQLSL